MSITSNYGSGVVKGDVGTLPEQMSDFAYEVLIRKAELIQALAQVYVHVDTGSLRDSIRVERGGVGWRWRVVRVRAGGYVTNPKTDKLVNYAGIIESKYPYMRPAFDEVFPTIRDEIEHSVISQLNNVLSNMTFFGERGAMVIQGQVFKT